MTKMIIVPVYIFQYNILYISDREYLLTLSRGGYRHICQSCDFTRFL